MIIITGGAGFIGSNFVRNWLSTVNEEVLIIDSLTYAGNLLNFSGMHKSDFLKFEKIDITDKDSISNAIQKVLPRAIIHFAAESHVDRSIHNPLSFVQTNILGTYILLDASRQYWNNLNTTAKNAFRFIHVSTDEVYGSLSLTDHPFTENNPYRPNSPYAASKASSDHLVRSYFSTYGMPVITTNCSNNYGPYQFPEKLIPLIIHNALTGLKIPIYGDGKQIRDWLYVGDHCNALYKVLEKGNPGETYNIGGSNEKENIEVVRAICKILDHLKPKLEGGSYIDQIAFVKDRPGHDRRYAIDSTKIQNELDWLPLETFESGLNKTVEWYLGNAHWIESVVSGEYQSWVTLNYE